MNPRDAKILLICRLSSRRCACTRVAVVVPCTSPFRIPHSSKPSFPYHSYEPLLPSFSRSFVLRFSPMFHVVIVLYPLPFGGKSPTKYVPPSNNVLTLDQNADVLGKCHWRNRIWRIELEPVCHCLSKNITEDGMCGVLLVESFYFLPPRLFPSLPRRCRCALKYVVYRFVTHSARHTLSLSSIQNVDMMVCGENLMQKLGKMNLFVLTSLHCLAMCFPID